ncbi:MAG: hypothetical protein ACRDDF_00190, partial [Aeromonas sp.]
IVSLLNSEKNGRCTFVLSRKENAQFKELIADIRDRRYAKVQKAQKRYQSGSQKVPKEQKRLLEALELFLRNGTKRGTPASSKTDKPRSQPGTGHQRMPAIKKAAPHSQTAKLIAYLSDGEKRTVRQLACTVSTSRTLLRPSLAKQAVHTILKIRNGALSGLISVREGEWVGFINEDDYHQYARTIEFGDPRVKVRAWHRETFLSRTATAAALAYACGFGTSAFKGEKERAKKLFHLIDTGLLEDAMNMVCIEKGPQTPPYQQGMSGNV